MFGWLKHKETPAPEERPVESEHFTEERLERLLNRLGTNNSTANAAAVAAALREIPPLQRANTRTAGEPTGEVLTEVDPIPRTDNKSGYAVGVVPDDYHEALPLLLKVIAVAGVQPEDDSRATAARIIDALRDRYSFTTALLSEINPYLEQFVHDIHAGVVQLDTEAEGAVSGGHVNAEEDAAEASAATTPPATSERVAPGEQAAEALAEILPSAESESVPAGEPAAEALTEISWSTKTGARTAQKPSGGELTPGESTGALSPMRVIAVCSQKGGAGKTTIAAHLAVRAGAAGQGPAVLIDTDPQGSLGEWWRARKDDTPALATVKLDDLAANLAELRSYGTAIAIIDTPPALTASIEQVIALADLVLIPARPSPHDLRAVGATVELARRAGKPFLFIVNGAAPRASITAQAVAALSEHGRVVPIILYQRTDYAASMIDGRTVMETAASGRSAREIADLWQYVYEQIGMRVAA